MQNQISASVVLFYTQGSSNKQYAVQLVSLPDGFAVHAQNGPRGGTLTPRVKLSGATEEKARKAYEKLVSDKMKEGYTTHVSGVPFTPSDASSAQGQSLGFTPPPAREATGLNPHLLTMVKEENVDRVRADTRWVAQEKMNGERLMTRIVDGSVIGSNKKGLARAIPVEIATELAKLPNDTELDGEIIGNVYHVFDMLKIAGADIRGANMIDRWEQLEVLLSRINCEIVPVVPTAISTDEKRRLEADVLARGGEGVVFKDMWAPYESGRHDAAPTQLKYPFLKSATCIVTADNTVDGTRSVGVSVFDKGVAVPVGNVTIPANKAVPVIGSFVEVTYLFANRGGALSQPRYQGERNDQDESDCSIDQLQYKNEPAAATPTSGPGR